MGRAIDIQIEIPEETPDMLVEAAQQAARERVVLFLQQEGVLTIREAAHDLGLTYEGYLDLLAARGLPATTGTTDPEVLAMLRKALH